MIEKHVYDICTSRADDAAYRALKDITDLTTDAPDSWVVGGHMVNILRLAYPTKHAIPRRTNDADAAISIQLATSGKIHAGLIALGYKATSGNHYKKDERRVDLLVPSGTDRFHHREYGGRGFDAAPGLLLDTQHISVTVNVTLKDETKINLALRVPTVERAIILKAYATKSRTLSKDLVDIFNLLTIVNEHSVDDIGGWHLADSGLTGTRKDTVRNLASALRSPVMRSQLEQTGVQPSHLLALAQKHIAPLRDEGPMRPKIPGLF